MSVADLRGFRYALQPVLERQRWCIEALQARLGEAQRAVAQAQQALEQRERELVERHAALVQARTRRLDPAVQVRSLRWLATERHAIRQQQGELERLKEQRAEVMAEYRAQEAKLEGLQQHRADTLADYVQSQQRRGLVAADNDWLARQAGRMGKTA